MNKEKVLVIEDNKSSRQAIQILLELNNINVVCASDEKHALKNMENNVFDIVLCAITIALPDNGDMLRQIKNNPKYYRIPVIIIAESAEEKDIRQCMNLGADDSISRPIAGKALISTIKARLELTKRHNEYYRNDINEQLFLLLNKNFNQELLTPINGILNSILLIEDLPLAADIDGLMDLVMVIYSASYRMQRTIQNLHTYALLNTENSANNIKINSEVNLQDVLKSVTLNYDNVLSPDYKKLDVQVIQDGRWVGPDSLVKILFTELIDNAVKHSHDATVPVVKLLALNGHFTFSVTYSSKETIYFSIEDIHPFRKFHNDLSRNGMGLGLYICKYISEKMGYQFTMTNDNNILTFTVESVKI